MTTVHLSGTVNELLNKEDSEIAEAVRMHLKEEECHKKALECGYSGPYFYGAVNFIGQFRGSNGTSFWRHSNVVETMTNCFKLLKWEDNEWVQRKIKVVVE